MKRILVLFGALLLCSLSAKSAYFSFLPFEIKQPDGEKINCFVSGDEFYHWIHDKDGYTIIQAPDGYYYYGVSTGDSIVATKYKVNSVDPNTLTIDKWEKISIREYQKVKDFFELDAEGDPIQPAPHTDTLNNLVVYIRFSDDAEFTAIRQSFDDKFNLYPGTSILSYFKEASYDNLIISSSHYPECEMNTNLSYQDSYPRAYYQPYNETTNPIGYEGGNNGTERRVREHTLLKNAIDWINVNSPVPASLDIDGDNDNYIDNVCFNIVGGNDGWAALLWAHSWALYSQTVYINGKRVYRYTFQPETQVSVKTLCHEMFHALGAPDLYHYSYDGLSPAGSWDLMHSGFGHMGAYMKWKYSNQTWISEIPEITSSGTYTLNPLASSTNNCYKIASPNSLSQYFVVEYRRKISGSFENNVPGSGLLVYRIDPSLNGNAYGPPDEVYIFRPDGTPAENGYINSAHFSSETGRTEINDYTNPYTFLQDGSLGGLSISNITSAGSTISFNINYHIVVPPSDFTATAISYSQIDLNWTLNDVSDNVLLAGNSSGNFGEPTDGIFYLPGDTIPGGDTIIYNGSLSTFNHLNLEPNTDYYYKIWSYNSDTIYSFGIDQYARTLCEPITLIPWLEDFSEAEMFPDCWTQEEVGDSRIYWYITADYEQGDPDTTEYNFYAFLNDYSTSDNVSRLIAPAFDLSNYSNVSLSFWHKQESWNGDQDELRVYYKTSASASWIELESYITEYSSWTEEVVSLPETSPDFYICFEGNAKYGYGICIDDIELTGTEITPETLSVTDVSYGTGDDECFGAQQTITVAGEGSTVDLLSGSIVNFIAGESISFLPGFHAHNGSYMDAYLTTTGTFCESAPVQSFVDAVVQEKSNPIGDNISDMPANQEPFMKIYPNPTHGAVKIELTNMEGNTMINIANSLGVIIYSSVLSENQAKLNLPPTQKGLYIVTIINSKATLTQKIIVY